MSRYRLPDTDDPLQLFLALATIPSASRQERELVEAISVWMKKRNIGFYIDGAADLTGGNTGNLIARVDLSPDLPTALFVAHLDTVQAQDDEIVPVVSRGRITSKGRTILGADNKSAVAAVLSMLTSAKDRRMNILAAFTTSEESGVMGAKALEALAGQVDYTFAVDGSYPIGTAINGSLGHLQFEARVTGKAAHAAKSPEKGIHAVRAAAQLAISLPSGWHGNHLINVGRIEGGGERNLVPASSVLYGEIRSATTDGMTQARELLLQRASETADTSGAKFEIIFDEQGFINPYSCPENSPVFKLFSKAAKQNGIASNVMQCAVTLEASVLSDCGLETLGVASGGTRPHAEEESLEIPELYSLTSLLRSIVCSTL